MIRQNLFGDKNLQIIFSITLIAVMGVTSVAPALPMISQALAIPGKEVVLIIVFFTLPGIFLSPVLGIMSDRFTRKIIIVPSLFLFGLAGAACGLTDNFRLLLFFRFLQGLGAAALGSMNLTLIGDLFKGEERLRAMGYNSAVLSVGTLVYPALGGLLANLGWNYPFFLALIALPVALVVLLVLDNPEPQSSESMGSYLKTALKLLLTKETLSLYGATLSTFILLYAVIIAGLPFFMDRAFRVPPSTIGLVISTASIATALGSSNLGRLSRTRFFSTKRLIILGFLLYGVSIASTPLAGSVYLVILPALIYGFANGINIPSIQTRLSSNAPMEYRGAFMSINSMVLRTGQTLGPLMAGFIISGWGIAGIFYSGALFALAMIPVIVLTLKEDSP